MNWRSIAVWTLVVVGSFLTLTSLLNAWAARQILSDTGWRTTSDRMLADPQVREAAAEALVAQLNKNVNLESILQKRFPRAAAFAPVAQQQAQGLLQSAAVDALGSPAAAKAWRAANDLAHSRAVAVLRGEKLGRRGAFTTDNGQIALDLSPIVQALGGRLGIAPQTADPNAGKIVLFSQSGLKQAQLGVKIVDNLSQWLIFVAFAMFIGAVWLARPLKRRGVVIAIGSFLFALGLILLLVRRIVINSVMPTLAKTESGKTAAVHIAEIVTSILHDLALFTLLLGLATLFWTWLAGQSSPARRLRSAFAPFGRQHAVIYHLCVVGLLLLLLLWSPTGSVHRLGGALVLLAIVLAGAEALRRQAVGEFVVNPAGTISVSSRPGPTMGENLGSLERLAALHSSGVLTDEEFARSKEQVLGSTEAAPEAPAAPAPEPPSEQA